MTIEEEFDYMYDNPIHTVENFSFQDLPKSLFGKEKPEINVTKREEPQLNDSNKNNFTFAEGKEYIV